VRIPGIPYAAIPRAGGLVSPRALGQPKLIVVHCTDNTAAAKSEANYAATRADGQSRWTSAHAYVDASGALGSLDLDLRAWAAFSWANGCAWHIELCGEENAVPDNVQRVGAALIRQLCLMAGIPMEHLDGAAIRALHDGTRTRGGITGHRDITQSHIDSNNHTDPGDRFDWARFIGWVTAGDGENNDMDFNQSQKLDAVFNLYPTVTLDTDAAPDGKGTLGRFPVPLTVWTQAVDRRLADLATRPAMVALTAEDKAELVAGLAMRIGPIAQQAAEAAVRHVLGGLDGASPPTDS
jgi:N-acetyl-anhydromuramyl-L-alanine amidase AmpD